MLVSKAESVQMNFKCGFLHVHLDDKYKFSMNSAKTHDDISMQFYFHMNLHIVYFKYTVDIQFTSWLNVI